MCQSGKKPLHTLGDEKVSMKKSVMMSVKKRHMLSLRQARQVLVTCKLNQVTFEIDTVASITFSDYVRATGDKNGELFKNTTT